MSLSTLFRRNSPLTLRPVLPMLLSEPRQFVEFAKRIAPIEDPRWTLEGIKRNRKERSE
jgi:hypothetical protein